MTFGNSVSLICFHRTIGNWDAIICFYIFSLDFPNSLVSRVSLSYHLRRITKMPYYLHSWHIHIGSILLICPIFFCTWQCFFKIEAGNSTIILIFLRIIEISLMDLREQRTIFDRLRITFFLSWRIIDGQYETNYL